MGRKVKKRIRIRKKKEETLADIYERKLIEALKELRVPALMLHFVLTTGTLGYMLLSDGDFIDAFYMTVITIGTIGFGEVAEGSDTPVGRMFTSLLALSGIGIFTTSVTMVVRLFFKEDIINLFRTLRMLREIENLKGHYIVCGYNRTSAWLVNMLKKRKIEFVVIEADERALKYIQDHQIKYFIIEDPYKKHVLKAGGIERAKGMIVNLQDDAKNIAVIATARLLRPDKDEFLIYSFASTEGTAQKLEELGANKALVPDRLLASRLASYIFHPESAYISSLFDRLAFGEESDIDIMEIRIFEGSPLAGKRLMDLDLRKNMKVSVIAVRKADGKLEVGITGMTQIEEGDTLIMFGEHKNLKKAKKFLESKVEA